MNPQISGNYIYAEGEPNKTFYDSEVCIYDIRKNEWGYKINNGYSRYKRYPNVGLMNLTAVGKYLLWDSGINHGLTIFDQKTNKLYNLVLEPNHAAVDEIRNFQLLDGGLLLWNNLKYGVNQNVKSYILLK